MNARRSVTTFLGQFPPIGSKRLSEIDTGALAGLRDRALLSVMLYSFARVSAVLGMRRQDYFAVEPRLAEAPREGREAARRAGPPPAAAALDACVEGGEL